MWKLLDEIETLTRTKKYEEAISLLENLALQGDHDAQNKLGEIYHFGQFGVTDYFKAREWYLKAVENGNGLAANHLGRMYTNSEGVKKNDEKAKYWYKKGMDLGDIYARRNYVIMMTQG